MYGVKGRKSRKANENYYNALAELRQFGRKIDNHVKEMKAYVQEMHNNSVYVQRDGLPERAQKFLKQEVGLDKRIKIFKDFRYQLSDMELQLKSGQTMANFADVGVMFSKTLQDKRLKQIFNPEFQRNLSSIMDQQTENIDKLSQMIEAFDSVVSTGIGVTDEEIKEKYEDIIREAGVSEPSVSKLGTATGTQNPASSEKSNNLDKEIEENLRKLRERK